jgi:hypothetical protein
VIPNIAVLEIQSPHWRTPRLWLPLFLLWIPVILFSPLILLTLLAACTIGGISTWKTCKGLWALLCGLRGLHLHVSSNRNKVLIRIL